MVTRPPATRLQPLRYLLVGGSGFVLDFFVLWLLRSPIGLPAWFSAAVAFTVGTIYTYLLQRSFTFSSRASHASASFRYLTLVAANTVFTAVVVELFDQVVTTPILGVSGYLVGKVVCAILTTLWNYPLLGRWVYAEKAGRSG